ncbi:MAG: hypothetical protein WDZ44_01075 [Candidatus Spechtbacterales bacterium]
MKSTYTCGIPYAEHKNRASYEKGLHVDRLIEIIEETTRTEVRGSAFRESRITVIRSEALRHYEELVLILLGQGISLQSDMLPIFRKGSMVEQYADLGLTADQFVKLMAVLKDLAETNPFAPPVTLELRENTLMRLLPADELPVVPWPHLRLLLRG